MIHSRTCGNSGPPELTYSAISVKRYLILFVVGALLMLGGQIWLNMVLHPGAAGTAMAILWCLVAVALGSAVIGTAMAGMADTYAAAAASVSCLLGTKMIPSQSPPVGAAAHLIQRSRSFWRGYICTSLLLCMLLLGLLGLFLALAQTTYLAYLVGVSGGIAILGTLTLLLGGRAFHAISCAHEDVVVSLQVLSRQPDRVEEPVDVPTRAGWTVRRRPPAPLRARTRPRPIIVR
jgi:hypothetical protein